MTGEYRVRYMVNDGSLESDLNEARMRGWEVHTFTISDLGEGQMLPVSTVLFQAREGSSNYRSDEPLQFLAREDDPLAWQVEEEKRARV